MLENKLYDKWVDWMLKENDALGLTSVGNRKHPQWTDAANWASDAWMELDVEHAIKKTAKRLGMTSELGPEIEGYVPMESAEEIPPPQHEAEVDVEVQGYA